jgi:hypothetical protein
MREVTPIELQTLLAEQEFFCWMCANRMSMTAFNIGGELIPLDGS